MKQTTKQRALLEGRALLQKHGYNGFSFQTIADKLGIKKPSLYDHFASKDALVIAIIADYSNRFDVWVQTLQDLRPLERVRRVFDVFHAFAADRAKVCPILALSADFQDLSRTIQKDMQRFVDKWLGWLEQQLRDGQELGDIRCDVTPNKLAGFIYSQAMGAQCQARIRKDPSLTLSSGAQMVLLIQNSPPGQVLG
jgi:TetR/AcrR family transcriptional repressor of nem operon